MCTTTHNPNHGVSFADANGVRTISNCGCCGTRGEVGTCYENSRFLASLDTEDGSHSIYMGYGAYYDGYIFLPTPEQVEAFHAAMGKTGVLCEECLVKALGAEVVAKTYFFGNEDVLETQELSLEDVLEYNRS